MGTTRSIDLSVGQYIQIWMSVGDINCVDQRTNIKERIIQIR